MPVSYPGSLKSFTPVSPGQTILAQHTDEIYAEISQIEKTLGQGSAGSYGTLHARVLRDESLLFRRAYYTPPGWPSPIAYSSVAVPTAYDITTWLGAPSGLKALYCRMVLRDSAAWGNAYWFAYGDSSDNWSMANGYCWGGDILKGTTLIIGVDDSDQIWYRCQASGVGTLDMWLEVYGVWYKP